jgi:glyceraldehyde-3-phosphate dehydrogenase (NAD(P))
MSSEPILRIAVNGFGVIGKRVADAVTLQDDMKLVGVADVVSDVRLTPAVERGFAVYAANGAAQTVMEDEGVSVVGQLVELLRQVDVVVDCTPKGVGARNLDLYRELGVSAILQGGEKHAATGHSFVAQANYRSAIGRDATRVVSCNTTSTIRTLHALDEAGLLRRARGVLIRRATDPWESDHSGIMNTIVPEQTIPSHQGPDARTVLPDLDVVTIAAKASHTQGHQHFWIVDLARATSREEVLDVFRGTARVALVQAANGFVALNSTFELMKDLGRPRGDMWEVAIWEDILTVEGDQAYYTYQVDNQAIVIPETIDAIRAVTGAVQDPAVSIARTDSALGLRRNFGGKT